MSDPTPLQKIQEQYPTAVELSVKARGETVTIIAISPSRVVWRQFRACLSDERKRPDAFEVLLRNCVKYPDAAGVEAMLEKRPALAETFGEQLAELAGAGLDVEKNG